MRKIIVYILIALYASAAFAAGGSEEIQSLGYPMSISSIPLMELVERYPDQYQGSVYTDHPQALGQLINGELDILASGFTVGYSRSFSAGDIGHLDTLVWGVSALMTAEEIDELSDIQGQVLYVPFEGSPIDVQVKALLEKEGLLDSVSIAYAPFPQAAGLLAQKRAGAAVLVEPIASRLEIGGQAFRFANIQDMYAEISGGEPRSPQVSIFVRTEYHPQQRRSLDQFRTRLKDIVQELQADGDAFAAKYGPVFDMPEPVIARAIESSLFGLFDAAEDRMLIETYADTMGVPQPADAFYLE